MIFSEEINVDKFRTVCDGQLFNAVFIKPNKIKCINCGNVKEFNDNNFSKCEAQKFGLKYTCKECENKYSTKLNYKKMGIYFNNIEDISPPIWWEHLHKKKINNMPTFCHTENNLIIIVKHIINNVLNLTTKEEISNVKYFGKKQIEKISYRIYML